MKKSVIAVITISILGIIAAYFFTQSSFKDALSSFGYSPSGEVLTLEEKLGFTDSAKTIFRATRPSLEDRDAFNEHCQSYDTDVSVLGCYTDNNIYIYNVTEKDLEGIVESTAAHEFLHAAWDRLSGSEKNDISVYLNQVYEQHHDTLASELELYDDNEQLDELHSRIGVQITNLPAELESYYARYFKDQDAIVAYYSHYIAPFEKIKESTEELKATIDAEKATIDTRTADYYARAEALSQSINEFNTCADTLGCFASTSEFNARRAELVAEQEALEELYASINTAVDNYNQLVEEYNNNILRTETLQNAINSNSPLNVELETN